MQNAKLDLAQQKLSISPQEVKKIRRLSSKKVSGREIARRLNISYSRIWRNMELLGLNKKMGQPKETNGQYFDCNSFQQYYKY